MKKYWPYLLIIILFSALLRLPVFFTEFINMDENEYAIAALKILDGGYPYKDFLIYHPPGIFYVFTLGFWLSGGANIWSAQLLSILFVIGTIISLFYLVKNLTNSTKAGLASALAYGAFSAAFIPQDMLAANCELMMALPLTLSVLAFLHAYKKEKNSYYLLAGIFAAFGVMMKYQGGVLIAAEGFFILVISAILSRSFSIKRNLLPSIILSIGFFIPFILVVLYLINGGAWPYTVEAWNYLLGYAGGPVQSDALYVLIKFLMRTAIFILPGIVMWIGASIVVVKGLKNILKIEANDKDHQFIIFSILWFLVSIIPVFLGGRIYFHYYIVPLPAASLLFGVWWAKRGQFKSKTFKTLAIIWLLICTIGWTIFTITWINRTPGPKDEWKNVATYLKETADKKDTLFVWGNSPQTYIFSELRNATRFTTADYLTGRSPMTAGLEYDPNMENPPSSFEKVINDFRDPQGVVVFNTDKNIFPTAWKYLEEDFAKGLPTYIVDCSPGNYRRYARYPMSKYPFLAKTIENNYELETRIKGFDIYKLKK